MLIFVYMEGVSLQQHYDDIRVMVKQKTGRAMQEKDVKFTDKKGKQRVRLGCSPIREGVVNIKPDTTMEDLLRYADRTTMLISSGTGWTTTRASPSS